MPDPIWSHSALTTNKWGSYLQGLSLVYQLDMVRGWENVAVRCQCFQHRVCKCVHCRAKCQHYAMTVFYAISCFHLHRFLTQIPMVIPVLRDSRRASPAGLAYGILCLPPRFILASQGQGVVCVLSCLKVALWSSSSIVCLGLEC